MIKMKIRKGDEVIVITGKDKGKRGKVLVVTPKLSRVVVSGVNFIKRHTKPTQTSDGGVVQKETWMHISKIAHIDPKDGKPTKIGFKILDDGSKVRIAKRSGEIIDKRGK